MTEVLNLAALKAYVPPTSTAPQLAYASGHTSAGDGGGGIFLWRQETTFTTGYYSADNNGTIIKPNVGNAGRWVRQYDDLINVLWFGISGDDNTVSIQNAINFATLNSNAGNSALSILKGATIFIPNGFYQVSNIILRPNVNILGESIDLTKIACKASSSASMFEMQPGVVITNVSNLHLLGFDTTKSCFLFKANSTDGNGAGLWYSTFKNISIEGFKGTGIDIVGGDTIENVNQFNVFENIRVRKGADFTYALRMKGQNGQFTYLNCQFDGFFTTDTSGVRTYSLGQNVYIENSTLNNVSWSSNVISFINSTFQDADYGVYLTFAENVTFDNCWFENLGVAVTLRPGCKAINVVNSRFANAAGFGTLVAPHNIKNGHNFSIEASTIAIKNNYILVGSGSNQNALFMVAIGAVGDYGIIQEGNMFSSQTLSKFTTPQISNTTILNAGGNKVVNVSPGNLPYNQIISKLNVGETLTIRATDSIIIGETGAILMGGRGQLNLKRNDSATFIRLGYEGSINEIYLLTAFHRSSMGTPN